MPSEPDIIRGAAWVFGDEINTDTMAPGLYFKESIEVLARHCLEVVDPDFAVAVQPGDIVVGGRNFGVGSAREQAAMAFRELGVGAIVARSFSRIFYRNAINFGLPLLTLPADAEIRPGDVLEVDPTRGTIDNTTLGKRYAVEPIPPHLMTMIEAGGLLPWLKSRCVKA
jgi:3-isopropylmalate/(R)-2-methylmalate dehydratase small subunit